MVGGSICTIIIHHISDDLSLSESPAGPISTWAPQHPVGCHLPQPRSKPSQTHYRNWYNSQSTWWSWMPDGYRGLWCRWSEPQPLTVNCQPPPYIREPSDKDPAADRPSPASADRLERVKSALDSRLASRDWDHRERYSQEKLLVHQLCQSADKMWSVWLLPLYLLSLFCAWCIYCNSGDLAFFHLLYGLESDTIDKTSAPPPSQQSCVITQTHVEMDALMWCEIISRISLPMSKFLKVIRSFVALQANFIFRFSSAL